MGRKPKIKQGEQNATSSDNDDQSGVGSTQQAGTAEKLQDNSGTGGSNASGGGGALPHTDLEGQTGGKVVDSRTVSPLVPTSSDAKPPRRRRTKTEIEAESGAAKAAEAARTDIARRELEEKSQKTCRTLMKGVAPFMGKVLPPAFTTEEEESIANAWALVMAQGGGDIPPWLAATIISVVALAPRVWWKITGDYPPESGVTKKEDA